MGPYSEQTIADYREAGLWGTLSIPVLFERNARAAPDRTAVVDPANRAALADGEPQRLTYAEMLRAVDGLAATFRADGIGRGDIVLVQMPNICELTVVYLAAASIGAIVSPVPVQYRTRELAAIVRLVAPRAFCTVTRFGRTRLAEQFVSGTAFDGIVYAAGIGLPDGARDLAAAIAGPSDSTPGPRNADPDSIFSICWTSGTEGQPKAVPKTHNNWLCSSASASEASRLEPGDALLVPFPFVNAASIGGLMMPWLRIGGTLVLHHPFDFDVFLDQIVAERVRYTIVAPALLASILQRDTDDRVARALALVRAVGTGSAPPDPSHVAAFEQRFDISVTNIFGSNEGVQLASSRAAVPDPAIRSRLFPRSGDIAWHQGERTANGCRFKLIDPESGAPVTLPGKAGEMRIAGPSVFPGYYSADGYDRSMFDADGFFRTGDLFEIVDDGDDARYVRFVGRSKELIVRGGMKIAPAEIDALLAAHPDVAEGAATAYFDERLGERVCAVVVPVEGRTVTLASIVAHCEREGLAAFKWPERLLIVDALPRNPLAKVQRARLREVVEADLATQAQRSA
tara:strand:+ start:383 stop:2095 length:1713 start_codon:yes stop_codon:yes gene_type:complete